MLVLLGSLLFYSTAFGGNLRPLYIKSENGENTVSRTWKKSKGSWKFIYGNWEICTQSSSNQFDILDTPYYPVVDRNIKKITVAIETTFPKSCKGEMKCKLWLNIFIEEKTNPLSYRYLKSMEIVAEKKYFRQYKIRHIIHVSLFKIKVGSALKFRIQSFNGSCASISNFHLYYHQCETFSKKHLIVNNLYYEPDTVTGEVSIKGQCIDNAVQDKRYDSLLQKCYANGTYDFHGTCICNKGYFLNGASCQKCQNGYFKNDPGNRPCKLCGKNSFQYGGNRLLCPCITGFFRVPKENADENDCYEAGNIQKLLYSNYSDAKVVISWEPSFYHPTHFPLYIVTINNRTTVMKNRILRFQSTNLTQTFNIKLRVSNSKVKQKKFNYRVITVVDIDGKKYRGEPYEEKIVVYPNPLLSSGCSLLPNILLVLLVSVFFHMVMKFQDFVKNPL